MITGEETGGTYTDYLTDALGSVTATVNQSEQVLNTYRYKPYGALLAKSGVGGDPPFQWQGANSVRLTDRLFAISFRDPSVYSSAAAHFITAPKHLLGLISRTLKAHQIIIGPLSKQPTYQPGCISARTIGFFITIPCIAASWTVECRLRLMCGDGYIVREARRSAWFADPCNQAGMDDPRPKPKRYWEAWQTKGGRICNGYCTGSNATVFQQDVFAYEYFPKNKPPCGALGEWSQHGFMKFFIGISIDWPLQDYAGGLPATEQEPDFWRFSGPADYHRWWTGSWDCCKEVTKPIIFRHPTD